MSASPGEPEGLKVTANSNATESRWRWLNRQGPSTITLGLALVYIGAAFLLLFYGDTETPFREVIARYGPGLLGVTVVMLGFGLAASEVLRSRDLKDAKFIDVDARSRPKSDDSSALLQLIEKIGSLEQSSKENFDELVAQFRSEQSSATATGDSRDEFIRYFHRIRRVFESKAEIADEKASILLDKGANYSKFGIAFYIFSIVVWQVLSRIFGFQKEYMYGIASCSLLFVFVEFLSAWFLKQYRQFVDTSTYLIKVKSIFDKYMLVYLSIKESSVNAQDVKRAHLQLIELLQTDIKWPESYLTRDPDASFAKEALDTMSLFVKSISSEVTHVTSKPAAKKKVRRPRQLV